MSEMKLEVLKIIDLDTTESKKLAEIVQQAKDADGFLHIEIRRVSNERCNWQ